MLLGKPCVFPESLFLVRDINFHEPFKCHGQVCCLLKKELPFPRQSVLLGGKPPFQLLLLHTLPVLEVEGSVPCALFAEDVMYTLFELDEHYPAPGCMRSQTLLTRTSQRTTWLSASAIACWMIS